MQTHELKADRRADVGSRSSRGLRNDGRIPAVLCGKGTDSLALHVSAKEFEDLRKKHARIVMLQVDGMSNAAVVHEVAWDTMTQEPLHVDFQRINMNEKIEIEVSIKVRGPSKGEVAGGILLVQSDAVRVRCLPLEIPESIEVDVRELELHGTVHVRDLKLPAGVDSAEDPAHLVLSIVEKVEAVVAAPAAAADAAATTAEPEVIAKAPKKDEAGDAAPAAGAKDAKDAKKPEKK
jgi:large subunit ribosomal protein L25